MLFKDAFQTNDDLIFDGCTTMSGTKAYHELQLGAEDNEDRRA